MYSQSSIGITWFPAHAAGWQLVWDIINGEPRTAIMLFRFDDGVDSGHVVGQAAINILPNDTWSLLNMESYLAQYLWELWSRLDQS